MSRTIGATDSITMRQARKMWQAKAFAERIHQPLNHALTLHLQAFLDLEHGGVADGGNLGAFRLFQGVLRDARRWMRRRGYPLAAIWVREGEGSPREHVHLAIHIPPRLVRDFSAMLPVWIGSTHPHAIDLKAVQTSLGGLSGWLGYMLKGGDDLVRAEYGVLKKHYRDQGRILGKRTGITTAINATAQVAFKTNHPLAVAAQTGNRLQFLLGRPAKAAQ